MVAAIERARTCDAFTPQVRIEFESTGRVRLVAVEATASAATPCIAAAFGAMRLPPFSRSRFTVAFELSP